MYKTLKCYISNDKLWVFLWETVNAYRNVFVGCGGQRFISSFSGEEVMMVASDFVSVLRFEVYFVWNLKSLHIQGLLKYNLSGDMLLISKKTVRNVKTMGAVKYANKYQFFNLQTNMKSVAIFSQNDSLMSSLDLFYSAVTSLNMEYHINFSNKTQNFETK